MSIVSDAAFKAWPLSSDFKGCVHYIVASLFFKFKQEPLSNLEKCFLFHFKSPFCSQENQILVF